MEGKLNVEQAAEYLGVKLKTLREWILKGKAPRHVKYLRRLWFDKKDLDAFKRAVTEVRAS